jgi:anti-sigma B factor antagonist
MEISSKMVDGVRVVEMRGRLDSVTAGPAGDSMDAIAKRPDKQVVLSLQHVDYVSSAGLRILLRAAKLLKTHRGELKLCNANPTVKHALEISGFNSLLTLVDTEDAAIRSFRASGAA